MPLSHHALGELPQQGRVAGFRTAGSQRWLLRNSHWHFLPAASIRRTARFPVLLKRYVVAK
jgi:hypothetical protein